MTQYALITLAGFAGSFHCLGMCGGFALALAPGRRGRWTTLGRHLMYNTGRLTTYTFLGTLSGLLGGVLAVHGPVGVLQRGLAVVAGILMILMGLQLFGYLGRFHLVISGLGTESLVHVLGSLLKTQGRAAPLAFGVFNGFLPCPLVYAFVAQAAASGGPLTGMLTMAAFGLGTYPAMLAAGGFGGLLRPSWRRGGLRLAGAFVVVFGLLTLARGIVPLSHVG